ncbi:amino acid ABC transporter permease [Galactobacter sp.]|uniref:amino acid ABC transporter permease n=1 Tax=Galactobacter sp. TaxID=2676125 RepID=UPI0025C6A066|nr:amino acid ABC transporter permease [Galactobacter sp.]
MAASVLFDAPGPKAKVRNKILAVLTVVVVLGIIAYLVYELQRSGQFEARKWEFLNFPLIWDQIIDGLLATLKGFALAAVGSLVVGFLLAIGRLSDHAWVRWIFTVIVELFRAIPVLILMMMLFYGLPSVGVSVSPFTAVVVALIAYNGSVLAEVFRAGVASLPKGQSEAAYAVGLRKTQVMTSILLPQAVKAMLPMIIAQLVVALKDTALGYAITYPELLAVVKLLGNQSRFDFPLIPAAIVGAVIYIGMCLILSGIAKYAEYRINRSPSVAKAKAKLDTAGGAALPKP